MATLSVPYSFQNATAIVASEMNSNFTAVKSFVEALAAGTNIDAGAIESTKLSTSTIQLLSPTGSIVQYAGSAAPIGWAICDGAAISRSTYAALFAVIGTTFGVGDGSTTFNLPNFKGRIAVGRDAIDASFDVLGETGGAKTHTLTSAEMPSHQHNVSAYAHTASASANNLSHTHTYSGTVVSNGSHSHGVTVNADGSHNHTVLAQKLGIASHGHADAAGLAAGSLQYTSVENYNNMGTAGNHSHSASTDSQGSHNHTFSGTSDGASIDMNHGHTITVDQHAAKLTDATGSGGAHNNLQPYLVVNYIIKI